MNVPEWRSDRAASRYVPVMTTFSKIPLLIGCLLGAPIAHGNPPSESAARPAQNEVSAEVVAVVTADGVPLQVDVYPGGEDVVVLLHMIPPHFDRSSWPAGFIAALRAEGWTVAVPDRRGAGASKGVAEDAYKGPGGREDVAAVVRHVQTRGTVQKLAIIGASNGTTSMVDYAHWSAANEMPVPVMLGFMTGGPYTENNLPLAKVAQIPAIYTYSTKERDWSESQRKVATKGVFHEYPGGDHGTKMFAVKPDVTRDLLAALKTHL